MEEGFMLGFPELVLNGQVANRDFLHLYGPSSLWVLAGVFDVSGTTLAVERVVGFLQQLGRGFRVCFALRPWVGRCATGSPPPAGSGRRGGRPPGAGRQVIGPAVHVVPDDLRRVVEALAELEMPEVLERPAVSTDRALRPPTPAKRAGVVVPPAFEEPARRPFLGESAALDTVSTEGRSVTAPRITWI
jgi:hypothetical protein